MSQLAEMTCQELVELVTEYLEGTLSSADRARFDAHLKDCPYCVTYLDQMRQVIQTLGRMTVVSMSKETQQELLRAFRDWKETR